MEAEKEISFIDLVKALNKERIRYIIIGRRALILYGIPVMTADYDLWISPEDREKTLTLLEKMGIELSEHPTTKKLIVFAYSSTKKFDLFFHRTITNLDGEKIIFDDCYQNAVTADSSNKAPQILIPSIDDLIKMKKIRNGSAKDIQDIEYLLKIKHMKKKK